MISVAEPELGDEELTNVIEAVNSGWVSSKGRFIPEFENNFSKYIGVKHGIAVSNGTAALHLALVASGIGPKDEVIVPDLTFAATINAVLYTGARPVIVDVNPDYWCIDPEEIEQAITPKTKAIIPVHLYGHSCDMTPILEIAEKRSLCIIEDAAEAIGAEYKNKKVGSFGLTSCFSFYGNKVITTGEGGMCLTDDDELVNKMRILRDHGMNPDKKYWHDVVGFNYRMTNLQAAIGVAQIRKIGRFLEKKRNIAKLYAETLSGLDGVTLHPQMPWAKCAYWLYSIIIKEKIIARNNLIQKLAAEGIESRPFFYPLHEMPPYKEMVSRDYPSSARLSQTGLSLPSSVKLSDNDILYVAQMLRKILESHKS
jgi:perosamine synthetase